MAKIALVRNEHVNEAVAYAIAPDVAMELRARGHEVKILTVPFKKTVWGEIAKRKKLPEGLVEFDRALRVEERRQHTREFLLPMDFVVRRLHNCPWPHGDPFIKMGDTVEIPAAYKPTANKSFREAGRHFKKLARQLAKQDWKETKLMSRQARLFRATAVYQKYASLARWYLEMQADVAKSRKKGLMSGERVKQIADLIEKTLETT